MSAEQDDQMDGLIRDLEAVDATVEITNGMNTIEVLITRPARHLPPGFDHPASLELGRSPRELVRDVRFTHREWRDFLADARSRGHLFNLPRPAPLPAAGPAPLLPAAASEDEQARYQFFVYLIFIWALVAAIVAEGRSQPPSAPTAAEKRIASATLGFAAFIAVGVREQARDEWIAEQSAAQAGELGATRARVRFSIGLIRAALWIRASRMAAPCLDLLDQIARSETRTCQTVGLTVLVTALYVFHAQGLIGVIADGASLIEGGGALYGMARWRRKILKDRDEIIGDEADADLPPDSLQ